MQLPDYHGGSIVNLMASLQSGLGGSAHTYPPLRLLSAERVAAHRQVVLWVIDGLGLNFLRAHPGAACLNRHLAGGMTSVYPPTTATAITTFLTGDAPQQHGLTGWHMYFHELGGVFSVLPARARYGGNSLGEAGVDLRALLGHVAFADRIGVDAFTVSPAHIARSDFNLAHLGRGRLHSYRTLDEMLARTAGILHTPGRRFVYAYWPELDSIGHRDGIHGETAAAHLAELDRAFAQFLERIQGTDTLVVVCADHGQVDSTESDRLSLDDHPELSDMLALPLCGEPRSVYCYLRPGMEQRFDDYITREFAGIARGFNPDELIDAGWFGLGEPHPQLRRRIGDRILLMQENYVLKDWLAQEKRYDLIGVHGGLSDDERLVPLILATA